MKQSKSAVSFFAMFASGFVLASGSPVLEIRGNIAAQPNSLKVYTLSANQLLAMPQSSITTATTWTPVSKFTGVKMEEIMRLTGAKGEYAHVYALDDYSVRIPVADFKRYGVVLAHSMNGRPLESNRFGPYFLIYPKDKHSKELNTPTSEAKFVWQVNRIVFQ
ncbi:molybdopterin-dependent oxidoreductase [Massilia sp. CCM 8734]|uniref:molybdopterin-dependent oxidoreductase n=1 Tax=Massilia sp. CCM 8734 TaxID=2609283 RepID=UPI00141F3EB7|nr:molybdopterin-dependent oxidoreductase [Massilia sp. CCM 8734]NHZ99073.1 molybdopterin-dependent oxidoreductase [Massilia sp. CCM 8734]